MSHDTIFWYTGVTVWGIIGVVTALGLLLTTIIALIKAYNIQQTWLNMRVFVTVSSQEQKAIMYALYKMGLQRESLEAINKVATCALRQYTLLEVARYKQEPLSRITRLGDSFGCEIELFSGETVKIVSKNCIGPIHLYNAVGVGDHEGHTYNNLMWFDFKLDDLEESE